jgi:hypothetical protein
MLRYDMYTAGMKTFRDIISKWPSVSDFADDIGVEENTAKQMRTRNSVNAKYWTSMVTAAQKRGIKLSYEQLSAAYREGVAA